MKEYKNIELMEKMMVETSDYLWQSMKKCQTAEKIVKKKDKKKDNKMIETKRLVMDVIKD